MHFYESMLDAEDIFSSPHWLDYHPCDEYWPIGRYDIELDEYESGEPSEQSGIPEEVLGPRDRWIPTDLWVDYVAARWERTRIRPDVCGSQQVTFSRVLEYRIRKHRKYARTVRDVLGLQLEALSEEKQEQRCVRILGTLGVLEPREQEYHELSNWVNSSVVQIPWAEYRCHYDLDTLTQNPLWPRIQWYLSNTNRDKGYSNWEHLGFGQWLRPISRREWSHEDHACRFILRLYDMINDLDWNREHASLPDYLVAERVIGSRIAESYDDRDKAWFGYSLLCLLIRSWQYKQQYTERAWADDDQLIPALQADYDPGYDIKYPPVQVGEVNLSPFTPWVYEDDLPKHIDFSDLDSDDEESREHAKQRVV